MRTALFIGVLLITACVITTSCVETTNDPLADGFYVKTTVPLLENSGGNRELRYRTSNGNDKIIWRCVPGTVLVHGGIAVFIGSWQGTDRDYANFDSGYAYYAARGNSTVVRIAKAILVRAAEENRSAPEEYFRRYYTDGLSETNGSVGFKFSSRVGINNPGLIVNLNWDQISQITETIVRTGKIHYDKMNRLSYRE